MPCGAVSGHRRALTAIRSGCGGYVAFRERNVSELELRVPLSEAENGACQVIVEELEDKVRVRVLVCFDPRQTSSRPLATSRTVQSASGSTGRLGTGLWST